MSADNTLGVKVVVDTSNASIPLDELKAIVDRLEASIHKLKSNLKTLDQRFKTVRTSTKKYAGDANAFAREIKNATDKPLREAIKTATTYTNSFIKNNNKLVKDVTDTGGELEKILSEEFGFAPDMSGSIEEMDKLSTAYGNAIDAMLDDTKRSTSISPKQFQKNINRALSGISQAEKQVYVPGTRSGRKERANAVLGGLKDIEEPGISQMENLSAAAGSLAGILGGPLDNAFGDIAQIQDYVAEETEGYDTKILRALKSVNKMAFGLGRLGRTIGFIGFVMSISGQRVIGIFGSVLKIFTNLVGEFSDVNRASVWLSSTMKGLAMAGLLTSERVTELIATYGDTFNASLDLGGQIAILQAKFQVLKNEAINPVITALGDFINKISPEDWDKLKTAVGEAASAFLTGLNPGLEALFGKPGEDGILTNDRIKMISDIGTFFGSFGSGIMMAASSLGDLAEKLGLVNTGSEDGTGTGGLTELGTNLGWLSAMLLVIGVPLTIVGAAIQAIGTAIDIVSAAITAAWTKVLLPFATKISIAFGIPVGIALALIAAAVASLILNWDELAKFYNMTLGPALDDFVEALGGTDGLGETWDHLVIGFKATLEPFKYFWEAVIATLSVVVTTATTAINAIKELKQLLGLGGNENLLEGKTFDTRHFPGMQFGGPIMESGIYRLHRGEYVVPASNTKGSFNMGNINFYISGVNDPNRIADEVSRILARKVRTSVVMI